MTVDYKPVANEVGANVETQDQYIADLAPGGALETGYKAGVVPSARMNKTVRQSSVMTAAIANFIAEQLASDVLDDGDVEALKLKFTQSVNIASGPWVNVVSKGADPTGAASSLAAFVDAAAAAANGTVVVPPGTFLIDDNFAPAANVSFCFLQGGVISVSAGKTATLLQLSPAMSPSPHFAGAGKTTIGTGGTNAYEAVWWLTGADYSQAIVAAINSAPELAYFGVPQRFKSKDYAFATRVIIPSDGISQHKGHVFEGQGGTLAPFKSRLTFSALPGLTAGQFDFGDDESYPTLRNFYMIHANAIPVVPADQLQHGSGVALGAMATYPHLQNLWLSYFNYGVYANGFCFYGAFDNLQCLYNYSAGFYGDGATINGTPFNGGQFSQTQNGPGILLRDIGSITMLRSTWREGNKGTEGHAVKASGFFAIGDQGSYQEDNEATDLYLYNVYPFWHAHYGLDFSYFDVRQAAGAPRIYSRQTGLDLRGNMFYNDPSVPPVLIELRGAPERPFGGYFVHAVGNHYRSATLTNIAHDNGMTIIDEKHPAYTFSFGYPEDFHVQAGAYIRNSDPDTMRVTQGWYAVQGGWCTPSGGSPPAVPQLGTTEINSSEVDLNTNTDWYVKGGDWITIAGVTWGVDNDPSVMVVHSDPGPVLLCEKSANQAVTNAAIAYQQAILLPHYAQDIITGEALDFAGSNIAMASGANVSLAGFTIPTGKKLCLDIMVQVAASANNALATVKKSLVIAANNAGTITFGKNDYVSLDASGGAQAFTISPTDAGGGLFRLFVSQSTGNPLLLSFAMRVSQLTTLPDRTE